MISTALPARSSALLAAVLVAALALVVLFVAQDPLNELLGGWGGFVALLALAPVPGLACLALWRTLPAYVLGSMVGVVVVLVGLAVMPSEVDEPAFSPWFAALLYAAGMTFTAALGGVVVGSWLSRTPTQD